MIRIFRLIKTEIRFPEKRKDYRLYDMDYSEIKNYDVGSIGDKSFPDQRDDETQSAAAL